MKTIIVVALSLSLLMGCSFVDLQTARTDFEYELPDGRRITYSSTKDQAGIDLLITEIDPTTDKIIKKWRLRVEKSGTPEGAYTALAQQQQSVADIMKLLIPLVAKAVKAAPMIP